MASVIAASGGSVTAAAAADACAGFKWDIGKEHALFTGQGTAIAAGKSVSSAPAVGVDRLYLVQLLPQHAVSFALAPGKQAPGDALYAGLATLKLDAPGNYRVSVDASLWIDVVGDGKLAPVVDYQGQPSCDSPHKIVEFDLSGARQFTLQVSGSAEASIRLTVTRGAAT